MRYRVLVFCLFLGALAGFSAATQYFAHVVQYHPDLGLPLFARFYYPFDIINWAIQFHVEGDLYHVATWIGLAVFAAFSIAGLIFYRKDSSLQAVGLYGQARWLKRRELAGLGLTKPGGIVLAQTDDATYSYNKKTDYWTTKRQGKLLTSSGPENTLLIAPTRKGKGVNTIIPTLMSWKESAVIYDIKRENWDRTAGYRKQFSHTIKFEPGDKNSSVRWNPLLEIRPGAHDTKDVQNLVALLSDQGAVEEKDPHWRLAAEQLLVGVILHVLYRYDNCNLAHVYEFLNSGNMEDAFNEMLNHKHHSDKPHPAVVTAARNMLNKPQNELGSIISTASTYVQLWQDEQLQHTTGESDFTLSQIANSKFPLSVYFVVSNEDEKRMRPLVRLFFQMLGQKLTARLDDKRWRVLLLIDEFPSLGKLDFIERQLAVCAGYGVRALLVSQSFNQLYQIYGQYTSIPDNCRYKVFLGADSVEDGRKMAEYLGTASVVKTSRSHSERPSSFIKSSQGENQSEEEVDLMTPSEIHTLPYDKVLIVIGGTHPYKGAKIFYYSDKRFQPLANLAPPATLNELLAECPDRVPSLWTQYHTSGPTPLPSTADAGTTRHTVAHGVGAVKSSASRAARVQPDYIVHPAHEQEGVDAPFLVSSLYVDRERRAMAAQKNKAVGAMPHAAAGAVSLDYTKNGASKEDDIDGLEAYSSPL